MDGVQHALSANEAGGFRAVYQFVVVTRITDMSEGDKTFRTEHSPRVLFHFVLSQIIRAVIIFVADLAHVGRMESILE